MKKSAKQVILAANVCTLSSARITYVLSPSPEPRLSLPSLKSDDDDASGRIPREQIFSTSRNSPARLTHSQIQIDRNQQPQPCSHSRPVPGRVFGCLAPAGRLRFLPGAGYVDYRGSACKGSQRFKNGLLLTYATRHSRRHAPQPPTPRHIFKSTATPGRLPPAITHGEQNTLTMLAWWLVFFFFLSFFLF